MKDGAFWNYYNLEELKILVEKFGTTDKIELKKLMRQENLTKNSEIKLDPDLEYKKLRNLKAQLEIWRMLKDYGISLEQTRKIIIGEQQLETPEIPFLQKNSDNGLCGLCNHEHTEVEPKVCKNVSCNCGMR